MIRVLINKLHKSKIAKNSMWMVAETIIQMIISLVVNKVVSKYLGVANYGIINYGLSFINFFNGICTLGLGTIVIKYLVNSKDEKRQGEIIGTCIWMRLLASSLSIILIFALVFILKHDSPVIIYVSMIQSISLLFDCFNTITWWYQYKLQSKFSVLATFIAYICSAAYRLSLVYFDKSIVWFSVSNIVLSSVIALILYTMYKRKNGPKMSINIDTGKCLIKESYHFILSSLMVAIYAQTDKMMIGSMIDDLSQVGLYSVSITIMQLWAFLPTAIIDSFKSTLFEIKKVSKEKYLKRLKQLYSIIIWLSIAYTGFIFVFGKRIVLLLYSEEYVGCLTSLRLVIFGVVFSFIGVIRGLWLVGEGKQKYAKYFSLFSAIANVIMNFILIPKYGINGAAIATVITQVITALIAPLLFKDTRECVSHVISGLLFRF